MSGEHIKDNNSNHAASGAASNTDDTQLETVLSDFRASVHAWSQATYRNRPMAYAPVSRFTFGHRSLAWSLSLAVVAGVASIGSYQYHQSDLAHQTAMQREAEHQRQLALAQHAREADELLAMVDSDVSRDVPSAMEPLSLMADDTTQ